MYFSIFIIQFFLCFSSLAAAVCVCAVEHNSYVDGELHNKYAPCNSIQWAGCVYVRDSIGSLCIEFQRTMKKFLHDNCMCCHCVDSLHIYLNMRKEISLIQSNFSVCLIHHHSSNSMQIKNAFVHQMQSIAFIMPQ